MILLCFLSQIIYMKIRDNYQKSKEQLATIKENSSNHRYYKCMDLKEYPQKNM